MLLARGALSSPRRRGRRHRRAAALAGADAAPGHRRTRNPTAPAPPTADEARRSVRRGSHADGEDHRLHQGHGHLGQCVRDADQGVQVGQRLSRQAGHQARRAADDHLHSRPTTPGSSTRPPSRSPSRRKPRRTATSPSANRRKAKRSNSSTAAPTMRSTTPTRRSPTISTRSGSTPRTCSSRNTSPTR